MDHLGIHNTCFWVLCFRASSKRKNYQQEFIDQQKHWATEQAWMNFEEITCRKSAWANRISPKPIPSESGAFVFWVLEQIMAMKQCRFQVYNMFAFRSCGICTFLSCNFGTQDACSVRVTQSLYIIGDSVLILWPLVWALHCSWPDGSGAPKGLASDSLKP